MTKLSVIIPVYNAESTLPRTLESLEHIAPENRNQIEVIAVDDGSTDRSSFILQQFVDAQASFRLMVVAQSNGGISSARNHGLAEAGGEWVFFLDADDELVFDPVAVLQSATDETCFGFSVEYCGTGRTPKPVRPALVSQSNWADVLTARNPFQPSSLLIRHDCIDNLFDESIAYVEDWLFWMSNLAIFERMRTIPNQVSARIHIHSGNISSQFENAGAARARVAELVLARHGDRLTWSQRNNLLIQQQIGRLQQRLSIQPSVFTRLPCGFSLYCKLWVYAITSTLGIRPTPYR